MAGKIITMNKLRKIIVLYGEGKSKRFISSYLQISRNTVKKYIKRFVSSKIPLEEIHLLGDSELESLLILSDIQSHSPQLQTLYAFFPYVEKELKRTGVTRQQLWEEYKEENINGLGISSFCSHFRRWQMKSKMIPTMHMTHKAGDKLFVDYAGKTLQIVDRETAEVKTVQFFVAVLGASQLTYAEASISQKKHDFIASVENALHFFGGIPKAIVPDNLRSAVTKSNRYEPEINETFLDFSEHYDTAVLPARIRAPKDKSLVEIMVKILYTRIYSPLRNTTFYSIEELNQAIWELLEKHNNTNFSGRTYSRYELFQEIEMQALGLLASNRFEIKKQALVKVIINGHVRLGEDGHYYSVPYIYIGKRVKILYTSKEVEIFYKYQRIAVHKRIKSRFNYSTIKEHLASQHQFMTDWNPQRFINWGAAIDKDVELYIARVLEKKKHPEQSYKSCMGILSLGKKVGNKRLISACRRALDYGIYNYKIILNILEKGLDTIDEKTNDNSLPKHNNIRGKDYYK